MSGTSARVLGLGSVGLLLFATLSVLYYVSTVTGSPTLLLAVVTVSVLAGVGLGQFFRPVVAVAVTLTLLAAGGYGYLQTLPQGLSLLATLAPIGRDTVALLTGLSVLRILNAGAWVLAVAPGPMFLASYLAIRRHYVGATVTGGATLGLFVLTGDASVATTLLGAVGAAGAVGFGDLDRRAGTTAGADVVALVLAVMVVATLTVSVVPAGGGVVTPESGGPIGGNGGSGDGTVQSSLVSTGDTVTVQGAIDLSPRVRFTVTSNEARYWRVGSYDRYTGEGWIRTGDSAPYRGQLRGPPGPSRAVRQSYRAKTRLAVMPAAWKPTELVEGPDARVTQSGGLRPAGSIQAGQRYTVESRVPVAGPEALSDAGTAYPEWIERLYTRLPSDTPDRLHERTDRITAGANTPYETARTIEWWLENNRRYSLSVERPEGNIADAFLFEMPAGYCTYFATTMVAMLRSQGIPARFVVGYTPGERVAGNQWVVRGLDSHAWVEVYFPDVGWVAFDPTPGGPRDDAEQRSIERARSNDASNVDTNRTGPDEWTPTPGSGTQTAGTPDNGTAGTETLPGRFGRLRRTPPAVTPDVGAVSDAPGGGGGGGGGGALPQLPGREHIALGVVMLAGAVAGVRRAGLPGRAYREVWLRYQPRRSPEDDVERAFERLEYLLARRGHVREPGETPRQLLAAVDDERAHRLLVLYERARYGGRATPADADEAVEIVEELLAERSLFRRLPGYS